MKNKANMPVEEDLKDEYEDGEEEIVEDEAILFVIAMDKQDTLQETVRTWL